LALDEKVGRPFQVEYLNTMSDGISDFELFSGKHCLVDHPTRRDSVAIRRVGKVSCGLSAGNSW